MRIITLLISILLIFVGVSFAALNASLVKVNLYVTQVELPVSLLLVISLGVGMLCGFFMLIFRVLKLKRENRSLKNKMKLTEKEIKNLRAIPLKDEH